MKTGNLCGLPSSSRAWGCAAGNGICWKPWAAALGHQRGGNPTLPLLGLWALISTELIMVGAEQRKGSRAEQSRGSQVCVWAGTSPPLPPAPGQGAAQPLLGPARGFVPAEPQGSCSAAGAQLWAVPMSQLCSSSLSHHSLGLTRWVQV